MKKLTYLLPVLFVLIYSCNKDNTSTNRMTSTSRVSHLYSSLDSLGKTWYQCNHTDYKGSFDTTYYYHSPHKPPFTLDTISNKPYYDGHLFYGSLVNDTTTSVGVSVEYLLDTSSTHSYPGTIHIIGSFGGIQDFYIKKVTNDSLNVVFISPTNHLDSTILNLTSHP
jgi:hypothetical protein